MGGGQAGDDRYMSRSAAIDCGTNATRLLIKDGDEDVVRMERVTGLGEGLDATGMLRPEAIERVIGALREYSALLEEHGVERRRAVATSAVRDARNRDEFLDPAEAALGFRPDVLTGLEEGRLAFAGAVAELDPGDGPFLVCDVGGGSTELVAGAATPDAVTSIDVGSVRVTERFLRGDPPSAGELADALDVVRTELDEAVRLNPPLLDAARLVGLGGTVTTMAAVEIGLREYRRDAIHHFKLTRDAAEDVFRTLATERASDRRFNPGLPEARVPTIVAGTLVVVAVMRFFGFDELIVSENDLLDALCALRAE